MGLRVQEQEHFQPDSIQLNVAALIKAQKIIDSWGSQKSYDVIGSLCRELYPGFRDALSFRDMMRGADAVIFNSTITPLHHHEAKLLFPTYTDDLDKKLAELPSYPEGHVADIVHTAAWAYFTLVKTHPLGDGNKRLGRMVLKRVLKGAGFRDIIFNDPRWFGKNHPEHIEALETTAKTGDLAHLEKYLLIMLADNYPPTNRSDARIRKEIDTVLVQKQEEIAQSPGVRGKEHIWDGFSKL